MNERKDSNRYNPLFHQILILGFNFLHLKILVKELALGVFWVFFFPSRKLTQDMAVIEL